MNRRVLLSSAAGIILAASAAATVYAAESWYQRVCQKCGDKGPKQQFKSPLPDGECSSFKGGKKCGGRTVHTPCSPPG
jgi:hypothetical protein